MERFAVYLAGKMRAFLRKGDPVLICFDSCDAGSLGQLFYDAALLCEAKPRFLRQDQRWKTLLREAFDCRAGTLIAPPLVVLGLTKLARARSTPLYLRNVITAGYPCAAWMKEGIRAGLDCKIWGCLDVGDPPMAAGFSCTAGRGVHLNSEEFDLAITDDAGQLLPPGNAGQLRLRCRRTDEWIQTDSVALVDMKNCTCGDSNPHIIGLKLAQFVDYELIGLAEHILRWTSVLDCRLVRGPLGLEIEIVTFSGEKLPKLPSCAKLIVRHWNPQTDVPFWLAPMRK